MFAQYKLPDTSIIDYRSKTYRRLYDFVNFFTKVRKIEILKTKRINNK